LQMVDIDDVARRFKHEMRFKNTEPNEDLEQPRFIGASETSR
jgi:hypothetical protein